MDKYKFDCGCEIDIVNHKIKECDGLPSLHIDFDNLNENCYSTWELFSKGTTKGVFQLEKNLGKVWSKKIKPTSIEDISALISLIRPGCLDAKLDGKNMTQHYVERKFGLEEVKYIHPALELILGTTYGILTYQEQAIKIASIIAGLNLQQADALRKAMGKKDAKLMKSLEQDFVDGCEKTGLVTREQGVELFDNIQKSNKYSFNKCIDGDIKLYRDYSGKYQPTIAEMYKIKNDKEYAKSVNKLSLHKKYCRFGYGTAYSMQNDRIKYNKIVDIRYAGIKPVYEITLSNGSKIATTSNHKYPTTSHHLDNIEIKQLSELKVGDLLFVKGDYEQCKNKYNWSDVEKQDINYNQYDGQGFPAGESNPAYTNGSYSKFIKNKKLIPNICNDCGNKNKRIETHHIDGNRKDSSITNLVKLCPSCHKKREYKNGRKRKGDKGYPIFSYEIVSISLIGKKDVYDIEMYAPYHTFVTESGIVTCNSHGVGYAKTSYATAYTKTHFPLHFCCSYLYYAREKMKPQEEIDEIIVDSKNINVDILTPDLRLLLNGDAGDFSLFKGKINFGVRSIKGCGDSHVQKLIKLVDDGEKLLDKTIDKWNWIELLFLVFLRINKTVTNGVISVGGVSHLGISRQAMLHDYNLCLTMLDNNDLDTIQQNIKNIYSVEDAIEILKKKPKIHKSRLNKYTELGKGVKDTPFSTEDSPVWIADKEMFYLGSSISCLKCETVTQSGNTTCKEFNSGKNEKNMTICGEIKSVRDFIIKNGNLAGQKMCFGTIEDSTGRTDFSLSPKQYTDFQNELFKGNIVLILGGRGNNDNFRVNKVITT